jgi:hypothetical protein
MHLPSKDDTRPMRAVRAAPPPSRTGLDRRALSMLLAGFAAGVLITLLVGYGLMLGGWLNPGGSSCPATTSLCPATPAFLPVCPTCGVSIVTVFAPTYTPSPTHTPDAAATATAACQIFESQFPSTPCPAQP